MGIGEFFYQIVTSEGLQCPLNSKRTDFGSGIFVGHSQ
jgi:hypothetical protein